MRVSKQDLFNTHDWSIDKPYKADFDYLNCVIDCVKLQPDHLFLIRPQLGPFLDPSELFVGLGSGLKTFRGYFLGLLSGSKICLGPYTIDFGFGSTAISFCF